jgi:multidrug transporter EmrE-like cation transporter
MRFNKRSYKLFIMIIYLELYIIMNNFNYIIYIIITIVIMEACAQSCIKQYSNSKNYLFFIAGIIFYSIVCYLLHLTYKYENIGISNLLWSGLSIIAMLVIGVLIFKEKIHVHDIFAILLIMSGIIIFKYTE